MKISIFLKSASILVATTLGAGIFALPYIFKQSGFFVSFLYLAILSAIVMFVHNLYWQDLFKFQERKRLLSLIKSYLGENNFIFGFIVVLFGLIFTLVVYIILGSSFLKFIIPAMGQKERYLLFWLVGSIPVVFNLKWFQRLEFLGAVFIIFLIAFIFATGLTSVKTVNIESINLSNAFLPFGPIIFSLAGWTAIEPIFEYQRQQKTLYKSLYKILIFSAVAVAALYMLFVFGILKSADYISEDTISGLLSWSKFKIMVLGSLGLFALWTSYIPILAEIKNSLSFDIGVGKKILNTTAPVFFPIIFVFLGFNQFLRVLGLVGGVFSAVQYIFIILVSKKIVHMGPIKKIASNFSVIIFVLAVIYELYTFI